MLKLNQDVRLNRLTLEHATNMYRYMCDPVVRYNLGLRNEPSIEKTKTWIINSLSNPSISPFAVLLKNQHVGNVILDHIDNYLASARLSIYIGEPSARQSRVGSTAVYLALSEGFKKMELHKVWLIVHSLNFAAMNTYIKLGFVTEGILRDEFILNGKRINVFYMGLLRKDFDDILVQ